MFDLLDRLERMGPSGAPISVGLGLIMAASAVLLVGWSLMAGTEISRWAVLGMQGGAFLAACLSGLFTMLGVRQRTGPRYPDPVDVFPSVPVAEFRAAMYGEDRPLAACADCRIHLPGAFSTGACPRCGSSLSWHHIETDEDAELVCSAVRD